MISYDKAHELANEIRESEEFQQYRALKESVFADEMNKNLYKEFKTINLAMNAAYLSGSQPESETMEKYQKLMGLLSLNSQVVEFMQAEFRMKQILSDIFKILSDAADLSLDFLSE